MELLKLFISKAKIDVDSDALRPVFESHPSAPDIFAFKDTLNHFGMDTILANIPKDHLTKLPKIFVTVLIEEGTKKTVIIEQIKRGQIKIYSGDGGHDTLSTESFFDLWTGIVFIVKEAHSVSFLKKQIHRPKSVFILTYIVGFLLFGIATWTSAMYSLCLAALHSVGLWLSLELVQLKYSGGDLRTTRLCSLLPSGNCNTALKFDSTGIFKGLSLLDLTVAYFTTLLALSVFYGLAYSKVIFWLSCASLVFVAYSLYIQAYHLRKWCLYCLGISAVLVTKFVFLAMLFSKLPNAGFPEAFKTLILLALTTGLWIAIRSMLIKYNGLVHEEVRLHCFLRMADYGYLGSSPSGVSEPECERVDYLKGVSIGNHDSGVRIVSILSMDCPGCSDVYRDIIAIHKARPNDFGFRMILTTKDDSATGDGTKVVERIMEIDSLQGKSRLIYALDDIFINDMPLHIWLKKWKSPRADSTMDIMKNRTFLMENNLRSTPITFLNGRQLTYPHCLRDLLYMLPR